MLIKISTFIINEVELHLANKLREIENKISSLETEVFILKIINLLINTHVSPETQKRMEKKLDYIQQPTKIIIIFHLYRSGE